MTMLEQPASAPIRAEEIIRDRGGIIRTAEAIKAGIHPRTIYQLRDAGILEQLTRGVYRLSDHGPVSNPDLVIVATRIPQAVICLVSALAFHEITTQIPHRVSFALPEGAESPRLDYPPISAHRFSSAAFTDGVDQHRIDGVNVWVYNPEKTIADCFKFRNKIGKDVVLEALKLYIERKGLNLGKLIGHAKTCRVHKVMQPYLEAIL